MARFFLDRIPFVALLLSQIISAVPRSADADDVFRVQIGFEGSYKVGRWTPIEVEYAGTADESDTCQVIVPDADGNPTVAPLSRAAGGEPGTSRFLDVFRTGRLDAPIRVRLGAETRTISPAENPLAIRPARQSVRFLGTLGAEDTISRAAAAANRTVDGVESERARAVSFSGWGGLPPAGDAWDALDVLFVSEDFSCSERQSDALRNWVGRGGHLILSIGDQGEAFQSSPLAAWIPAGIDGSRTVNELATLNDRVPGAASFHAAVGIVAAQLDARNGEVLIPSFEGPLAARFAHGFGRVTVFALDYTATPLNNWDGTAELCLVLADVDLAQDAETGSANQSQLRSTGISDLVTQLASNLDSFPAVAKPSYGTVLAIVMCFLIVIGPVDYLLVHHLLKRPRRTWITFSSAILVAACCGAVVARQSHPPERLANQLDLVDIDVAGSATNVRSWSCIYSPHAGRQSVEFTTVPWISGNEEGAPRTTWFGKPESGFRGMYRAGGVEMANPAYEFAPEYASIENLPIDQWSTKSVYAAQELSWETPLVQSNLVDNGSGELTGTLTHYLPGPVTDWILAYGGFAYFPGTGTSRASERGIAPGVPFEPASMLPVPRILQHYLVGRQYIFIDRGDKLGGDAVPSRQTYDPLNRDPLDLIRTITFHEAAGGRRFTGLNNYSLSRSDFSHLLPLQRAVLLGRIDGGAARFTVDGVEIVAADSSTFVRIVLPVEPASASGAN